MPMTAGSMLDNQQALNKLGSQLPNLVSLGLVVALGYTFAQLGWQYLAPEEPAAADNTAVPVKKAVEKPQQGLGNITRSHLFGKEVRSSVKPTQTKTPVSKLNATLRGVLAANPEKFSTAIISAGKGKEEIYSIGDKIQNGVVLREIHADHVIIERQGKYEKLVLTKSRGGSSNITRNSRPKNTQKTNKSTNLGDIRREIMKNPTSFGEYALPVVVKQNGKQIGYRLKPQKKGELLGQYGLQASDIITEINGVSLDKPQNGIKALRELSSAQSVNLTVKRGNSFVPLNITLQ